MAKIISVEPREKYYSAKIEQVFMEGEPLKESKKVQEYKVWKNSHPEFIKGLKPNSVIEIISACDKGWGPELTNYEVIKEGRLGLSKEQSEELLSFLIQVLSSIQLNGREDSEIKNIAFDIERLIIEHQGRFTTAPAAKGHHHSYIGGLLKHTHETMEEVPPYNNLAILGAILHDFGKIWEYKIDTETGIIEYNEAFRDSLGLTKETKIYPHILWAYNWCIERGFKELAHLVGSHHGTVEHGAIFKPSTPEAHMLYIADYKSSHLGAITVDLLPEEVNS